MEAKKNIMETENVTTFEKVDIDNLDEIEEVVTPGWGTIGCCTE